MMIEQIAEIDELETYKGKWTVLDITQVGIFTDGGVYESEEEAWFFIKKWNAGAAALCKEKVGRVVSSDGSHKYWLGELIDSFPIPIGEDK